MRILSLSLIGAALGSAASALDSKICGECHAAIYRSYSATPMARTSGTVSASTAPLTGRTEFVDAGTAIRLRITRENSVTWIHFAKADIEGKRRLDYFIGAGVLGRSYASNMDGFLFQAPVSYYAATGDWDLSPGFESSDHLQLTRPVEPACLNCHASGLRTVAETVNGYQSPAFEEPGVSCERCHGPGATHIARMKAGDTQHGTGIVNPAKLDIAERDSVCGQCHLVGAIRIAKLDGGGYVPGRRLFDSTAAFLWKGEQQRTSNSHFEQLVSSACWKKSSGKLWCGSCHLVHGTIPVANRREFYRQRCLACHSVDSRQCGAPLRERSTAHDDCAACHMPLKPITTVAHSTQVDHTIARIPRATPLREADSAELVSFPGSTSTDRELGLAYASEALPRNNRAWGELALQLLEKAAASHPGDAAMTSQLAQLYDRKGMERKACDDFAQAVKNDAPGTAALINFGTCQAKDGDLASAAKTWSAALRRNPGLEAARLNLAVAKARLGDPESSSATLHEAFVYDPFSLAVQQLLKSIEGN